VGDEQKREDLLRSHGIGVVRFCWEHLEQPGVLRERMDRDRRASREYRARVESRRTD
jgi:regulator of protease activity HflC (stomatin/prohibitin superfamily)